MKILSGYDKVALGFIAVVIVFFGIAVYFSNQRVEGNKDTANQNAESAYTIKIEKEKSFGGALKTDPVAYYTEVLAFATIALAIFTIVLACVTILIWVDGKESSAKQNVASRRMLIHAAKNSQAAVKAAKAAIRAASASEKQMFAAVAAGLPVLRFTAPQLWNVEEQIEGDGPYASTPVEMLPPPLSVVTGINIRNIGKSFADLQSLSMGWIVGQPANKLLFFETIYTLPIVDAEGARTIDAGPFHIEIADDIKANITVEAPLRFYCRLEYSDFVGNVWVETATWKWAQLSGVGPYDFLRDYDTSAHCNQKKRIWEPSDSGRHPYVNLRSA